MSCRIKCFYSIPSWCSLNRKHYFLQALGHHLWCKTLFSVYSVHGSCHKRYILGPPTLSITTQSLLRLRFIQTYLSMHLCLLDVHEAWIHPDLALIEFVGSLAILNSLFPLIAPSLL